jgi:hypothetical protein
MCPACLTTTALAVTGVTSAGGLSTLAVTKLRARNAAKRGDLATATPEAGTDRSPAWTVPESCREMSGSPHASST